MLSVPHGFIVVCMLLCFSLTGIEGKQRTFELNISKGPWDMDCNEKAPNSDEQVMMINGQHPGPAIRATLNDDIHVIVRNHGNEPTTVHYHGILQIDTTESDGMPNITQHEIQPGGEFHHRFRLVGQTGTFFYHAHVALQDDSVQGPFIVYPTEDAWPANVNGGEEEDGESNLEKRDGGDDELHRKLVDGPYHYDDERIIQLSEWWAQTPQDRLDYYLGPDYNGLIPADHYLINGRAGSTSGGQDPIACPGMAAVDVAHGEVYRVRVIGAVSFATLGFAIAKHKMTIIEMDGNLIEPYETTYLEVSSGQRYSVLLEANQEPGTSYNMDVQPYWITNTTASGRAILNYRGDGKDKRTRSDLARHCPKEFSLTTQHPTTDPTVPVFPPGVNQWIFPQVKPLADDKLDFKAKPDRTIILMPKEHIIGKGNTTRWLINGRRMPIHETPLLEQLKQESQGNQQHNRRSSIVRRGMNATAMKLNKEGDWDGYDEDLQTYPMQHGEVVDVVIHTTSLINHGICAGHPWHSHGFVHYPIAHGLGEYNHETDKDLRTYEHPVAKDTSFVYPGTTELLEEVGVPCGWTKVRVYADNPGLWAFHCHVTSHMLQGMMVIVEMAADQIKYLGQ